MKLSKIHNYLKDLDGDNRLNEEREIDTKLIKEASHSKVNKFALFLCELFALEGVSAAYTKGEYPELYHRYKGTKDALTRMVKFLGVAMWNKTASFMDPSEIIKNDIKPAKDKNLYYIDLDPYGGRDSFALEDIEKNLYIEPRNMQRVIDKVVR